MFVDGRGNIVGRLFAVGFGLIFVLTGGGFGGLTAYAEYQDMERMDRLETTEGTVLSTDVEQDREREQQDDGEGEVETEYYPRATYTYTVDGETYEGNRVYAPSRTNREPGELRGKDFERRAAAAAAIGFQSGDTVTVYYYPDDPTNAFLRPPRFNLVAFLLPLGVGLVFTVIGGVVVLGGLFGSIGDDGE